MTVPLFLLAGVFVLPASGSAVQDLSRAAGIPHDAALAPAGIPDIDGGPLSFLPPEEAAAIPVPEGIPEYERAGLLPLFDRDGVRDVVGFFSASQGLYRVYDLEGEMVSFEEEGLESPLLDPVLLVVGGGMAIVKGSFMVAVKGAARGLFILASKKAAASLGGGSKALRRALSDDVYRSLRAVYRGLHPPEFRALP